MPRRIEEPIRSFGGDLPHNRPGGLIEFDGVRGAVGPRPLQFPGISAGDDDLSGAFVFRALAHDAGGKARPADPNALALKRAEFFHPACHFRQTDGGNRVFDGKGGGARHAAGRNGSRAPARQAA